jgi:hypothetical protein
MAREGANQDLKESFDSNSPKAKLDLVKDLVAIANSGGGEIIFGRGEQNITGLPADQIAALDSAKVADQVEKYIAPLSVRLSHEIDESIPGKPTLSLHIQPAETPIVISKDGIWTPPGKKYEEFVLRKGDIWIRHSSKNEHATAEDLRSWIYRARAAEKSAILERVGMLVDLPEGSDIRVVASTGSPIETPSQLLQTARARLEWDSDHLLSSDELLWIYSQRNSITLSYDDLRLLIASALRKSTTLHYWIGLADYSPHLIVQTLQAALVAGDRDKSDAGKNVIELAAFYADEQELRQILESLRNSDYKHFREAAEDWKGRDAAQRAAVRRINSASHENKALVDFPPADLDRLGTELASRARRESNSMVARKLSNVNRVFWARRTGRAQILKARAKTA